MKRTQCSCLLALTVLIGCGDGAPKEVASSPTLVGSWRAVLGSPGGELPFELVIRDGDNGLSAVAVSGAEEAPFSSVRRQGDEVVLEFDWYDSRIVATLESSGESSGDRLTGEWSKRAPDGRSRLSFEARRGVAPRFVSPQEAGLAAGATEGPAGELADISGDWQITFVDDSGSEPARGELRQEGKRVIGTILTPVGDYRFLEGSYEQGVLRLSTFDGAHAFLFQAHAKADGSLAGDFWSRDSYHATWTAQRTSEDAEVLPDAWQLVSLTNDQGIFRFEFPDLDGQLVADTDAAFEGRVVLVNIFGSWCPNCNDEAPLLAEWDRRYRDAGLSIVGLAYEFTGDRARDSGVLRRFAERYGIEYPLLLAGISDKVAAAETLPDLSAVVAYPTSLFIGRDGRVRKIYTGFSGPGTGARHDQLKATMRQLIEELLAEGTTTS